MSEHGNDQAEWRLNVQRVEVGLGHECCRPSDTSLLLRLATDSIARWEAEARAEKSDDLTVPFIVVGVDMRPERGTVAFILEWQEGWTAPPPSED